MAAEANESRDDDGNNNTTNEEEDQEEAQQPQPTQQLLDMDTLIENQQWQQVVTLLEATPEEARRVVNPSLGWTKLHWLCSIGAAPTSLIALVGRLYPQAITMPDNRYGDTPLHIICRNSVTQPTKLRILLSHLVSTPNESDDDTDAAADTAADPPRPPPRIEGLLIRNRFGGTALHSACNHNAVLDVLKALVLTNPRIVRVTTHDGMHAISALYSAYIQTIPGYMSVARILKGEAQDLDEQHAAHFDRFWKKVEYLSTAVYRGATTAATSTSTTTTSTTSAATGERTSNHDNHDNNEDGDSAMRQQQCMFVLHGLLQSHGVSLNFYQLALKWNPLYARAVDVETGNLPLHVLLERRPFRLKERDAIQATLEAYPQAAARRNHAGSNDSDNSNNNNNRGKECGDLPLLIAVRNKIPWHNGLDLIAQASPVSSAIEGREYAVTGGLYPFQLAASVGGRVAVETTFHLLLMQPDLLSA